MSKVLSGKSIVLGVTGGIAAYKSCYLVSSLTKLNATVDVIMTQNATKFVSPLTFQSLSKRPVVSDTFSLSYPFEIEHIALAKKASLFVVAPATANIIAKMANGIADDMLSTTLLATKAPILVVPAMNTNMWENTVTQENIQKLKNRGVYILEPDGGMLACGDLGKGRMPEPDVILQEIESLLTQKDLTGLSILVSAGSTIEEIDPVRYISNYSSGKMGYAIAKRAAERGAKVSLVSGNTSIEKPRNTDIISVKSTDDMYRKMLELAPENDVVIQAAAPCDFTIDRAQNKLKKNGSGKLELELYETQDIAKSIGEKKKKGQIFVGFAAETENLIENAKKKLKNKNLDFIVANDVSKPGAGFFADTNIISIIDEKEIKDYPLMSKLEAADVILDKVRGK